MTTCIEISKGNVFVNKTQTNDPTLIGLALLDIAETNQSSIIKSKTNENDQNT